MIALKWFLIGLAAGHLFWAIVFYIAWYRMTKAGDQSITEAVQQDFKEVREAIRRRMAPRN